MRSDGGSKKQPPQQGGGGGGGGGGVPRHGRTAGFISLRAISSYLRIVSSGASTVARSAASVASSIVDRDDDAGQDLVNWAGFDKLECEGTTARQVLLLGYRSGFQVWDVEEADNVRDLVSRNAGPVSFMQMLPKPIVASSSRSEDKFADTRPLLVVCADGNNLLEGQSQDSTSVGGFVPTAVFFYSLRSQSFVYNIKFRSVVYSVRCSPRVVAISLATQIHCVNATTLEREYTILTNPVVSGVPTSGSIGCGPLAVGPRWLAYSGSPVSVSNSGRVSPQHLTPSESFPGFGSNGSLVAHYAKESSKQIAVGIVTLGDLGYKKLSRYCSELLPDTNGNSHQFRGTGTGTGPGWKVINGTVNGHLTDADSVGMVIVKDIVSKAVIAQFRAHKSPISALCFDPSGTLLVTASVQGHNINVFKIMPVLAGSSDTSTSHVHLFRLQRGLTNAVIQDISFSIDSNWIMISSSRGTNHLFAINPMSGSVNPPSSEANFTAKNHQSRSAAIHWLPNPAPQSPAHHHHTATNPVTLSAVSRIRNGNNSNSWRGTVTGAAAAAAGRAGPLSGAVASSFHHCRGKNSYLDPNPSKAKYHLLVFSPSGCMIQYGLRISPNGPDFSPAGPDPGQEYDPRLAVEAIQKWNICQKQNRREREDNNADIYGENGNSENGNKIYPEFPQVKGLNKGKIAPEDNHHLYIAEAELQMHEARSPLWAKPEIYFQAMVMEGVIMDQETGSGGEIEIERILTHTVEARSKNLVPVFDYLQTTKYQKTRNSSASDNNSNGRYPQQRSAAPENGRLSRRNSSASLDSLTESGPGVEETTINNKRFVHTNESSKITTQLEIVNNRESLKTEPRLKFVNSNNNKNNVQGPKMENHFEDHSDEID